MDEKSDQDFKRKAHFDLWLHQNQLFWSRFQLLYIIQGAFFIIISTIKSEKSLIYIALAVTLVLMAWLYSTLDQDRRLRNHHAHKLKVQFKFDPLPETITTPRWFSSSAIEILFQLSIFVPFVFIDSFAARHLANSG
jgi:hypothetical protein